MYIYKTTNLINGKIYIGQKSNLRGIDSYLGSGTIIKQAIKKYGHVNFNKKIIEKCKNKDELNRREKYWIAYYASTDREIGYNILEGGKVGWGNPEVWLGRKHKDSTKRKISENHHNVRGKNNPMYGKKHKKETRSKIAESKIGTKHTLETRKGMSLSRMGEGNSNARLTTKIIASIRKDFLLGTKQVEICLKYGLKKACVNKIIKNKTWIDDTYELYKNNPRILFVNKSLKIKTD